MQALREFLQQLIAAGGGYARNNRAVFNVVAGTLAVASMLAVLFYLFDPGAPVILASDLAPANRTALALRLRHHGIPFTLQADSITVPRSDLRDARRLLEASPGYSGGGEGFSLFDRSTLGQSDFDQQVNYQRSLQGELERTIMDIRGILSARVMLAMGRPSPFVLGQDQATHASVMLSTAPGRSVDFSMASTIAHLVASSVRGLSPENVTVTGQDGVVLYPPPRGGELAEAVRVRNEIERRLGAKVSGLLGRIMGRNRYAAEVSVELDTSKVSTTEQIYGKDGKPAITSEEHSTEPVAAQTGGIPGLTANLPRRIEDASSEALPSSAPSPSGVGAKPVPAALASKNVINYQPSSRRVTTRNAPFGIRRISVAVVLDGTYDGGEFKPLSAPRLQTITELVSAAVGARKSRGDSVRVESAALSQPYVPPVPSPATQLRSLLSDPTHLYAAIGVTALMAMMLLWMVVRALRRLFGGRRKPAVQEQAQTAKTETPMRPFEAQGAEESEAPEPEESAYAELRTKINQEAERDPAAVAEMVRRWIQADDRATSNHEETTNVQ